MYYLDFSEIIISQYQYYQFSLIISINGKQLPTNDIGDKNLVPYIANHLQWKTFVDQMVFVKLSQ